MKSNHRLSSVNSRECFYEYIAQCCGTRQICRAKNLQTEDGVSIPVVGKTGTTNGYRNAAFVGMVPKAQAGTWELMEGVTVATYVGFDDNTPMRFGRTTLSGASGALPVWMETVRGIGQSTFIGYPKVEMEFSAPEEFGFHSVVVNRITGHVNENGKLNVDLQSNVLWGQEPTIFEHLHQLMPMKFRSGKSLARFKTTNTSELTDVRLTFSC